MDASTTRFEAEIARYNQWREELTQSVHAYHDWLEANHQLDVQQSIRFYDLLENLNRGRLMLAFLAEFSRGKSELINALFFSSFKERLLPSDVGRTTMCPTEIFHDPSEEPYLKLLSVETRYRDESISQLKNVPVEWSKVRLNVNSAADMKKALKSLADTKQVYALEARMLGLAPMANEKGEMPGEEELVEVPAWRYAMINFPHPLLSNGLSILDTPGLNALGMEPELTVSTVPNAHAILFLLSIDTGVTKSDLEIWERYVRQGLPQKIAVLNKVDLMWDELKSQAEIDKAIARMVDTTAGHLQLPRERIFPISAQKALLGKIKEDRALVEKSGIDKLERFMAEEIVPMRRQILCRAVVDEIGGMMVSSRAQLAKKQQANLAEIAELNGLVGKSREVVQKLWAKITAEKNAYNAALAEYKVNFSQFSAKKAALQDRLNTSKLDAALATSAQAIEDSWTTIGLQRGMAELVRVMSENFETVFRESEDIKKLMQGVYNTFISKFGFQKMTVPALDLDPHRTKLQLLVHQTEAFVKDPVNVVVKEKHFVVKNFYNTLVKEARRNFTDAKNMTDRWLQAVILPLEVQIKDHKAQLQSRLDNLSKINEKTTSINDQMAVVKASEADLKKQRDMIEGLIARVSAHAATASLSAEAPAAPLAAGARPAPAIDTLQTMKMAAAPAPGITTMVRSPLVSDDLMAELGKIAPAAAATPAPSSATTTVTQAPKPSPLKAASPRPEREPKPFEPAATQKLGPEDRTERTDGRERTERVQPAEPENTQRMPSNAEKTQQIPELDPSYRPDATQKMDAQSTQRLDDTITRLQEAKRLLQEANKK
ncbi:MAG TPA: dynamin family protein [Usitatibacter sp.]|nr:dynamin family protein [Usitatibacter sp.]